MKITDFQCIYNGKSQQCDAYGNNVAIACPSCKHPLILVARNNMKGSASTRPAVCRNCDKAYYLVVQEDKKLIKLKNI